MERPFQIDDTVRLVNGSSTMIILDCEYFHCYSKSSMPIPYKFAKNKMPRKGWYVRARYLSEMRYNKDQLNLPKWREAEHYVHKDVKGETDMSIKPGTLFSTKEEPPRFGTFLIKDSKGHYVLEMKANEGVKTFDPDHVEEVRPHTVGLRLFQGGDNESSIRHYEIAAGKVEVGDVLVQLSTGRLVEVVGVDTKMNAGKSKNGFLKLEGVRVTTE